MKKLLLSAVALGALTVTATAADLPRRTVAPAPMMASPVLMAAPLFTWSGFYAGVHVGGAFDDGENFGFDRDLFVPRVGGGEFQVRRDGGGNFFNSGRGGDNGGLLGGVQVGVNVQTGAFVFGLEADASFTGFDNGRSGRFGDGDFGRADAGGFAGGPAVAGFGVAANAGGGNNVAFFNGRGFGGTESIDSFGTIRGRVGVAFDRLLVYGTAGFAWANLGDEDHHGGGFRNGAEVADQNGGFFLNADARNRARNVEGTFRNHNGFDDWGTAWGAGVEYAFTNTLTVKVEGLYVKFDGGRRGGRDEVVGVSNTGAAITAQDFRGGRSNADFGLIRAGLNFKFNTF
jgi:outer membrane immunogenic protein